MVAGFSWFNENMAGGTYNLQLFNADGTGVAWGVGTKKPMKEGINC